MTITYFPRDITLEEARQIAVHDWQAGVLPGYSFDEVISNADVETRDCGWLFKDLPLSDLCIDVPTKANCVYITKRGGSLQLMNPEKELWGRIAIEDIEKTFGINNRYFGTVERLAKIGIYP